jgi:hypothetical protein
MTLAGRGLRHDVIVATAPGDPPQRHEMILGRVAGGPKRAFSAKLTNQPDQIRDGRCAVVRAGLGCAGTAARAQPTAPISQKRSIVGCCGTLRI